MKEKPNIDKAFGNRLQQLRKEVGIDQRELSARIEGLSYGSIQRHEAGYLPNAANLQKYCDFYGVARNWLLTGMAPEKIDLTPGGGSPMIAREPEKEYNENGGWKPRATSKEWRLLGRALEVLISGTFYAEALEKSIEAMYAAVMQESRREKGLEETE